MKHLKIFLVSAALALATGLAADHHEKPEDGEGKDKPGMGEDMHEGMHGGGPDGMLQKLGLSDEQKKKLKELKRARRDKNQGLHDKLEDTREALQALMQKVDRSKAHEEKIRAKQAELSTLQQEQCKQMTEGLLEMRSILTDEQLKKMVEMHKDGGGRGNWKKWREKGGMRGKKGGKGGPDRDDSDEDDKDPRDEKHEEHGKKDKG